MGFCILKSLFIDVSLMNLTFTTNLLPTTSANAMRAQIYSHTHLTSPFPRRRIANDRSVLRDVFSVFLNGKRHDFMHWCSDLIGSLEFWWALDPRILERLASNVRLMAYIRRALAKGWVDCWNRDSTRKYLKRFKYLERRIVILVSITSNKNSICYVS